MKRCFNLFFSLALFISLFLMTSCTGEKEDFYIISGSENESLQPIIEEFANKTNYNIHMEYMGSVDIMHALKEGASGYDAVWPANSLWIALGDENHLVKYEKSIMYSPIVFGIKKSLAQKLGFVNREVSVNDIIEAINTGELSFIMTSATQSNSGANAYLGFIYAILGKEDVITMEDLKRPELKEQLVNLLGGINRSSGSSGWLKDLFLNGDYSAMVNYEALIIETNQELEKQRKEPLYVVYPYDGIVLADSPLGYVDHGDEKKETFFRELQEYLLSKKVQEELVQRGRRTAFSDILGTASDQVFSTDWGIQKNRILSSKPTPEAKVIFEALRLYQTEFKKPSFTIYCLDYSGSMTGQGERELKSAMTYLLSQDFGEENLLQFGEKDMTCVITFSDSISNIWETEGCKTQDLKNMTALINRLTPNGGTDIYTPVMKGIEILKSKDYKDYIYSIVLMTDGQSNSGRNFSELQQYYSRAGIDIPVFSILFGDASEDQLEEIEILTNSRIFDGKNNLLEAFRKVKGYN